VPLFILPAGFGVDRGALDLFGLGSGPARDDPGLHELRDTQIGRRGLPSLIGHGQRRGPGAVGSAAADAPARFQRP